MNIFEQASREKTRFVVAKGNLSTEDLWDLSLESLDTIARGLNKQLKDLDEESFIAKKSTASTKLNLQFEIAKHIINVKLAEADRKKLLKDRAEKRAQLKELIEKKIRNAQEEKSIEELEKELAELDEV